jgi:hypothetical protein
MTVHLFIGPTLPRAETAALGDFVCLPPVAQGDVLRSAKARPQAIGIVDGYFDGAPAVWHKEILWALTQGIHVFGSASMGALRAAELHPFGMRGVGRIFEAYRSGEIEDDDEVAVLHGPAETGYVALSEPLVNIRVTMEEAERAGVVGPEMRVAVMGRAKDLFYHERSWERILATAGAADDVRRLCEWLPTGRVDQKQRDARAMIDAMREFLAGNPGPLRPTFKFEWTDMWEIATESIVARGEDGRAVGSVPLEDWVLDELRLDAAAFEPVRQRALLRSLARDGSASRTRTIEPLALREAEQRLRSRLGLLRRTDMERWCADNGLVIADFARLVEDEARLAAMEDRLDATIGRDLLDQLRIDGDYERFARRAREKHAALSARGLQDATAVDCGLAPIGLVAWHFEAQRGQAMPDDLAAYARRLGLSKISDFYRVLAREWLYSRQGKVGADRK